MSSTICRFINYTPTKDTTLSLRYKVGVLKPNTTATLVVDDLDYPNEPTQYISLSSSSWSTASAFLTSGHNYGIWIDVRFFVSIHEGSDQTSSIVYIDNVLFEEEVNDPVIVGYDLSEKPYYDFTYIRKGHFAANGQQQVTLPDYFKDMNFDVYITPAGNWDWNIQYPPKITLLSVNNKIPSFTLEFFAYPFVEVDFIYTVVLID